MSDGCRESIQSNALLMSVESIPINCLESTASFQSSVSLSKVVSQTMFFPVRRYAGIELGIKIIITNGEQNLFAPMGAQTLEVLQS